MREILFRGKRLDNGKWYYGSYLFLRIPPEDSTGKPLGGPEDVHYIIDEKDINYAVDRATVGQYTAVSDIDGTIIYEGDILESQIGDRHKWIVSWADGGFVIAQIGVKPKNRKAAGTIDELCSNNSAFYRLRIIGNIHDSPELMREVEA